MTCIVAVIKDNKVYMGGDSAGVAGLDIRERRDTKVFKVQDFLIGYTSSFRMGQVLRYQLKVSKQISEQEDYEYMCTNFIDAVRKVLKSAGFSKVSSNEEEIGTFLVGYKGKIYLIADDLQVGEHYDEYDSVGCGHKYALGALNALDRNLTGKEQVIKALESAVKFSGGVRPPFNILSEE